MHTICVDPKAGEYLELASLRCAGNIKFYRAQKPKSTICYGLNERRQERSAQPFNDCSCAFVLPTQIVFTSYYMIV